MTTTDAAASYQSLRGHLAYLKLTRAEEVLAAHLEAARAQQLSHVAFLEALLGEEVAATRQRRHRARLRFAHFPLTKHLRDFDYDFQPSVDRALVEELATLAFLDAGTHALFMGPPEVGKTHLAIGLGHEVVAAGYRVDYTTTAADLVAAMHAAFLEGTWTQKLRFYTAPSLLVIDELGYLPMDRRGAHALFQVIDRRNQAGNSICLTTNRSFASWGEIFEDDTVAAAILDRLLGNAVVINIRRRELPDAHPPPPAPGDPQGGNHQALTDPTTRRRVGRFNGNLRGLSPAVDTGPGRRGVLDPDAVLGGSACGCRLLPRIGDAGSATGSPQRARGVGARP